MLTITAEGCDSIITSACSKGTNTKSRRTVAIKNIIIVLILYILITNVVILLDVYGLRQFLGYIFITFIPGFIILIWAADEYEICDIILYSVGLSLSFLMLGGFFVDYVSFYYFNIELPLTINVFLPASNITIFAILFAIYVKKSKDVINIKYDCLKRNDLLLLIIPVMFPTAAFIGIICLKNFSNFVLYTLVIMIIIYIILIGFGKVELSDLTYILIIFTISIALLILIFFRTNYIYVSDSVGEYYLFCKLNEVEHYFKFRNEYDNIGACLSITVLPTIYNIITGIQPGVVFKLVYLLPLSFIPIITYKLARNLLPNNYSFISSFFLISQQPFLDQIASFRTTLSIFFFSMAILAFYSLKIDQMQRRKFFILLLFSGTVSHYSNSMIMFLILLIFSITTMIITPKISNYNYGEYTIHLTTTLLLFIFIFIWYAQITNGAFNDIVLFGSKAIERLTYFFVLETRAPVVYTAMGSTSEYAFVIINRWLSIIFIFIGIMFSLLHILLQKQSRYKNVFFPCNVTRENPSNIFLIIFSSICAFFFGFATIAPYVFQGYSLGRTYFQVVVFLSIFFTVGGMIFAQYLKVPYGIRPAIVLLVLLISFSSNICLFDELKNRPSSMILNAPQLVKDPYYVYDAEVKAINWLQLFSDKNTTYFCDRFGCDKIAQVGLINRGNIDRRELFFAISSLQKGYIYLTYDNINKGVIYKKPAEVRFEELNISTIINKLTYKNKIYTNGGSDVFN